VVILISKDRGVDSVEKETVEQIENLKKEFIKARKEFLGSVSSFYIRLLKWTIENSPKEKQDEIARKARIDFTAWREETREAHKKTVDEMIIYLKNQFDYSIARAEETEKRILAFADLFKEMLHYFLEEAKVIESLEKEIIALQFPAQ
jgi:dGTP triphosphohydrolase